MIPMESIAVKYKINAIISQFKMNNLAFNTLIR